MNKITLSLGLILAAGGLSAVAEDYKVDDSKLPKVAAKTGGTFEADIKPLLEKSCLQCHSEDKPKGKYTIETL